MKRLWYVGPPITGTLPLPEGYTPEPDWQVTGCEFEDDLAARVLAKHGPGGSRQWSDKAPGKPAVKGD